jgi:Tol biopolymer transport system component
VSSSGAEGNFHSRGLPFISEDGRHVLFTSGASNLVPNDGNGFDDLFLHDRDPDGNGLFDEGNGTTERISVAFDGGDPDGPSFDGSMTRDANVIAFTSSATNLLAADLNGKDDIFIRIRSTGTNVRMSKNDSNVGGDDDSFQSQISADGSAVVFASKATNLGAPSVPGGDIYVRDRLKNKTEWISVDANGNGASQPSDLPSISGDGSLVLFRSYASNFFPENDPSGLSQDLFVKDRATGAIDCMTVDSTGFAGHSATDASICADGSKVTFHSGFGFVPVDLNSADDIFVRDVATKSTVCADVDCAGLPVSGGANLRSSLSVDGRYVVFSSYSSDLVDLDTNGSLDVFVNDLTNPGFQASRTTYGAGWPGTGGVIPSLTASADPEFGADFDLVATNSSGRWAVGFLLYGFDDASIPMKNSGTVLVDIAFSDIVVLPPLGWTSPESIPYDPALCEVAYYLQLVESDPAATKGLSFTPGLELVICR